MAWRNCADLQFLPQLKTDHSNTPNLASEFGFHTTWRFIVYTADGNRLRSIEQQMGEHHRLNWAMMVLGMVMGFVGLYFIVARPMSRELRTMRIEITRMQSQMEGLTGQGEQVWETNSLLASLKLQQAELAEARDSIQMIRKLNADITEAADRSRYCLSHVTAISHLQDRIIAEQPSIEIAGRTMDDFVQLAERIAATQETLQPAAQQLEHLSELQEDLSALATQMPQAQAAVQQMGSLQAELREQSTGMNDAWLGLRGLTMLKTGLLNGAQYVELAQAIGDQLLTMQQKLAEQAHGSDVALNRVHQLLEVNAALNRHDLNVQSAQENLNSLRTLQQDLNELPSLARSIESLEMLSGFHEEFIDQIQLLGSMRRSLMEIGLMESSVARAVRMLQPLLELGNVRRMSDDELRSAARVILHDRNARLSDRSTRDSVQYETSGKKDVFVPEPSGEE